MAIADSRCVFFPMRRSSLLSYFFSESFALWDRRMSDRFHLMDGIATPVLTVIVALVVVMVLFSKFVEWVGPSSGGLGSREVAKAISMAR
jgi:hypothetical protein